MIALVGQLDTDIVHSETVQEMPRQFTAGAGDIRPVNAMFLDGVLDPPLRRRNCGDEQSNSDKRDNGHAT